MGSALNFRHFGPLGDPAPQQTIRDRLGARSMALFERLYVEGASVDDVCAEFGMSREAVYSWRLRLKRHVRALTGGAT